MQKIRILFDLCSGWGVGDSVQSCILWKHLRKYRPNWQIDVRAPEVFSAAIVPFINKFWCSDLGLCVTGEYESIVTLSWTDCFETFSDSPSTKVTFALKNVFGIEEYDQSLGRYEVVADKDVLERPPSNAIACHFVGNSHPDKKNLDLSCRETIRRCVQELGSMPLGLDYYRGVGELAAAISGCRAFIGIDSGPGKVASATNTPSLICWTGHHPLRYHDPAPNTTHLLPEKWWERPMCEGFGKYDDPLKHNALYWFTQNYEYRIYREGELAQEACRWLRETLS